MCCCNAATQRNKIVRKWRLSNKSCLHYVTPSEKVLPYTRSCKLDTSHKPSGELVYKTNTKKQCGGLEFPFFLNYLHTCYDLSEAKLGIGVDAGLLGSGAENIARKHICHPLSSGGRIGGCVFVGIGLRWLLFGLCLAGVRRNWCASELGIVGWCSSELVFVGVVARPRAMLVSCDCECFTAAWKQIVLFCQFRHQVKLTVALCLVYRQDHSDETYFRQTQKDKHQFDEQLRPHTNSGENKFRPIPSDEHQRRPTPTSLTWQTIPLGGGGGLANPGYISWCTAQRYTELCYPTQSHIG